MSDDFDKGHETGWAAGWDDGYSEGQHAREKQLEEIPDCLPTEGFLATTIWNRNDNEAPRYMLGQPNTGTFYGSSKNALRYNNRGDSESRKTEVWRAHVTWEKVENPNE